MIPRSDLECVTPYKSVQTKGIRLDLNENRMGPSPRVIEALRKIRAKDISSYPEYRGLIEKVADYLSVNPENVLLTNGADDAIRCVLDAYLEKGDEMLLAKPTFSMFGLLGKIRGARIVKVAYNEDLSFPTQRFLDAITERTRVVVVVNPDNPTGASIGEGELLKILKKASHSIVLLDETYHQFLGGSNVGLIKKFQNLIVIHSFSKVFGLAGLRLGYLVSNEKNIKNLKKVSLPFPVNSLAVMGGLAALDDIDFAERVVEEVEEEKRFLKKGLEKWGKVRMTRTNFLLLYAGKSCSKVQQRLMSRGVLVKDLSYESLLEGYLRISVGTRRENEILLRTLEDVVPPEAILFDMDGVLIDVSSSYRVAIKKTVEHFLGEKIEMKEVKEYKKKGYNDDWELTQAMVSSRGLDIPMEEIVEEFQKLYLGSEFDGYIKNERWLLDKGLLDRFKKDYRLGIVTGRPRMEAEYVLDRFRMREYFDALVTKEDAPGKPDPSGINLALRKLGVKRAVYVGDNVDDIRAAKAAGVTPIAIGKEFLKSGATLVLKSVSEIEEAL